MSEAFNNWLNQEPNKSEFLWSWQTIRNQGATPGMVRYLMQYAFQGGQTCSNEPSHEDSGSSGSLPEVFHFQDIPFATCSVCGCVTEHTRVEDPELRIDGYACRVCDELNVNDFVEYPFNGERV